MLGQADMHNLPVITSAAIASHVAGTTTVARSGGQLED